ncbi:TraB/GumN family protein [Kangiella sp. HD9-110m-PIT-SAG07]|nr:TraB/GumN family protein [Kangiella sp. HD9-110m-PIT-SAG07]
MNKFLGILLAGILGIQGCGDDPVKPQADANTNNETKVSDPLPKSEEKTKDKATDEQSSAAEDYTPALWKIEHQGKTSYLFGSVHMGDKSMYPLPQVVTEAYQSSDALAVEIDLGNINQMAIAQKVQQMAIDPNNSLESVLKEKTLVEYNEYCEETKSPCKMFSSFEPWFAAMTLEALNMQQSGYSEQYGVDMYFLDQARKDKEIVELESIDFQLEALDGMPLELQDAFLYSVVTKSEDENDKLIKAWKSGEVEAYVENSFEEAKESGIDEEDYQYFMELLLYNRNQGMADGIAEHIEQGKSVFAVVGAAHYGGDKSVNYYLEEKGFSVERIDY